jgi:putative ABC transport system ATP-binding protein
MKIIEIENLVKLYRTAEIETSALNGVNLTINQGDFVSIMGPSGCGKSTLLHVMGMIDNASEGQYKLLGEDVTQYPERKRAPIRKSNIGFVFQNFNLIDELTVFENVELSLQYNNVPTRERRPQIEATLERINMSHRMNHFPPQLSGGQQQRVAVARATVNKPNLILADEPTGNLDSEHGIEVMKILTRLNAEGTTVVMVTHSEENASYGERIVQMLDGRCVAEKTTDQAHV